MESWHLLQIPGWLLGLAFFAQLVLIVLLVKAAFKLRDLDALVRGNQATWMAQLRDARSKARLFAEASFGAGEELRNGMRNYPLALKVILWLACRKPASL